MEHFTILLLEEYKDNFTECTVKLYVCIPDTVACVTVENKPSNNSENHISTLWMMANTQVAGRGSTENH